MQKYTFKICSILKTKLELEKEIAFINDSMVVCLSFGFPDKRMIFYIFFSFLILILTLRVRIIDFNIISHYISPCERQSIYTFGFTCNIKRYYSKIRNCLL